MPEAPRTKGGSPSADSSSWAEHVMADWAPRVAQAPPGVPVGSLAVRGEAELGFQQLSELMHLPGVDVVGTLPPDIQLVTVCSAAVCAASAQAFVSFLASPRAAAAKLAHGMEPA